MPFTNYSDNAILLARIEALELAFYGRITGVPLNSFLVGDANGVASPLAAPVPIALGGTGSGTQNFVGLIGNQSVAGNKTFTGAINFTDTTPATSTTTGFNFAGGLSALGNVFAGGKIAPCSSPATEWGIDFTTGGSTITLAPSATYDLATGSGMVVIYDQNDGHYNFMFASAGGVYSVIGTASGSIVAGSPASEKVGLFYNAGTGKYRILNNRSTTRTLLISSLKMRGTS